ncbi:MAG: hypothetical protein ACI9TH_004107 [Kiritimatiellia bacterium]|jgi:hypothetical protein
MKDANMIKWVIAVMSTFTCMSGNLLADAPLVYQGTEGVGKGKHIVFIANDHEYRSEQTCPLMAKILAKHHGFTCTVLFGLNDDGTIGSGVNNLPGLDVLKDADLVFLFARFMNLPDEQSALLVDYFERGGPVVGVRTSTHAFNGVKGVWEKLNFNYDGADYRGGLGEQVFGNTWHKERGQSHYGSNHLKASRITPVPESVDHVILQGIKQIHAYSGAYSSQVPEGGVPLLQVQVLATFEPGDALEPGKEIVNAGWARDHYVAPSGARQEARVVYTSYGASEDLKDEGARRFIVNACLWAAGLEKAITPDLDVSIVGGFAPSPYSSSVLFYEGVRPSDLAAFNSQIMPATAPLANVGDAKMRGKVIRVLPNRPALAKKLAALHPELYGPAAKPVQQPPKRKPKKR